MSGQHTSLSFPHVLYQFILRVCLDIPRPGPVSFLSCTYSPSSLPESSPTRQFRGCAQGARLVLERNASTNS